MRCYLLYLEASQLSAFIWQGGKLLAEAAFRADSTGFAEFSGYLAARCDAPFHLLANLAEETYARETIPFLRGKERLALTARKAGQLFPPPALSAIFSLGYEKTGRKNEKLLISALTDPESFEPWLQVMADHEIALSGIYSTAQLAGRLLKKLGHSTPRSLLLSLLKHSIRESYLIDGQTVFSRQVEISDTSLPALARDFALEAGRLHQYLIAQRLISRGDPLPLLIIAHPEAAAAIGESCRHGHGLECRLIDNQSAAARLKLKTPPTDSCSDQLFLHLLATHRPRQQFADPARRANFRLRRIRRTLFALGLGTLLGSSLLAAANTYQAARLDAEAGELMRQEARMNKRYQEIAATFPQLGISHQALRRVTERYAELRRQQHHLLPALQKLGRILDQIPGIELESLDWQVDKPTTTNDGNPAVSHETLIVSGVIEHEEAATPRQILALFERFKHLANAEGAWHIDIIDAPYTMDAQHIVAGGAEPDSAPTAARFRWQMRRPLSP